jgi:hypothetical protein
MRLHRWGAFDRNPRNRRTLTAGIRQQTGLPAQHSQHPSSHLDGTFGEKASINRPEGSKGLDPDQKDLKPRYP